MLVDWDSLCDKGTGQQARPWPTGGSGGTTGDPGQRRQRDHPGHFRSVVDPACPK